MDFFAKLSFVMIGADGNLIHSIPFSSSIQLFGHEVSYFLVPNLAKYNLNVFAVKSCFILEFRTYFDDYND
jgi:hypothetical protein